MPRPKKYPHAMYVRLSDEGKEGLEKTAATMDLPPAVAARIIIESSVKAEPVNIIEKISDEQ